MGFSTNNIVLTGFWPPTNEMLRQFSPNAAQNGGTWRGENWRGLGFDIYAFFPEFDKPPEEVGPGDVGTGDFTVDYQDVSRDWRRISRAYRPCAIITFSRGWNPPVWELEARVRNLDSWGDDYVAPHQPTPSPPDASRSAGTILNSTLPMSEIRDAINDADHLGIRAYIDDSNEFTGGFVSEFAGYHGCWYQADHSGEDVDAMCFAAGHIHVGRQVPIGRAVEATEITLIELIKHLKKRRPNFWISEIMFRVRTKDAPTAGTDDLITVEIVRDGDHLVTGRLDFDHIDDHERGDDRSYRFVLPRRYTDRTPNLPPWIEELLGWNPPLAPPAGIEFSDGIEGHLRCRLRIGGDDLWIKDDVEILVKETRLARRDDELEWTPQARFISLGRWGVDARLSRDSSEGSSTWTLLV